MPAKFAPTVARIPPLRTTLLDPSQDNGTAKEWYQYWGSTGQKVNTLVTEGTHGKRPVAGDMPDGAIYVESDRGAIYTNEAGAWHYLAGSMWNTLNPDMRPTDLGANDAGFLFRSIDSSDQYAPQSFTWSGSAWINTTTVLYGTHAARPIANYATPPRTLYVETDRSGVIYQNQANAWHYLGGTMWGTMSPDQRPTDLGANDAGFQYRSNDQPPRFFIWSGSAWAELAPWVFGAAGVPEFRGLTNSGYIEVNTTTFPGYSGLAFFSANNKIGSIEIDGGLNTVNIYNNLYSSSVPAFRIASTGYVGLGIAPAYLLQLATDSAAKPGTSAWTVASDIRTKRNVQRFEGGLEITRQLDPIIAEYNGKGGTPEGARVVSFDAARLREVLPHAVSSVCGKLNPNDAEETDLLGVNTHEVFFHMLRAIQQMDIEIQRLRTQIGT
ncbi:MAG: hypothetical protein C5B60_08830 [Chloroflexi bacterium]|nr:MAG: hypothetical protein C5B60_08830 [Chloroflexota bacterium]